MQITKPTKAESDERAEGLYLHHSGTHQLCTGMGGILIPYQITTGGTTGIGAIIYYATGFPSSGHTSSSMPY